VSCADLSVSPNDRAGAADGKKWCITACPENAAAVYTPDRRAITSCACLPNFRRDTSKPGFTCAWSQDVECSIFTTCTKANTAPTRCSQGNFSCLINDYLEGICIDLVTGDQIADCIAACRWSCDTACIANTCANNSSASCTKACCHSSDPSCR
jgi:hypothetical protein